MREEFLQDHAGTPLGHGYPSGSPLRLDGETHRQAWMRLLRAQPCAYCGAAVSPVLAPAGTVDHIDARLARGWTDEDGVRHEPYRGADVHTWLNFTAACAPCNWSKRDEPMLLWLARRRVLAG